MSSKTDTLYIFLHMPKCAGTTLRYHIEKNFRNEEILGFYNSDRRKLQKRDVFDILQALTEAERDRLKIIYGHEVHYGIHKYFNKPSRYFTFLRDPVEKTISFYNYRIQRGVYDYRTQKGGKNEQTKQDGPPSFKTWLDNHPGMHDGMLGDFLRYGYGGDTDSDEDSLKHILDKFYFVGITERSEEDALFMYYKLGVHRFYADQNKTKKKFVADDDEETRRIIRSKTQRDQKLYDYALELNERFRTDTTDFNRIVRHMKIKKLMWLYGGRFLTR